MTTERPGGLPEPLLAEIRACGYFPDLIIDGVALAVGGEPVEAFLVHHEATFNHEALRRHLSVLALTATRLIVGHTDEGEAPGEQGQALTTTESVALGRLTSVALSRIVSRPEHYGAGLAEVTEAWLTIGWGTVRRLELEPAVCGDPTCEADHGYGGSLAADDLSVRVSSAADGAGKVTDLVRFAALLQQARGR